MIRFFTNYSYGGYEELYLGNIEDNDEYRYHLPLLQVKKAQLADNPSDEKLQKEVERLSSFPLILRNGATPEATLPEGAFPLISNPGFRTIYRRLGNNYVVVVSDVVGHDNDEMGGGNRSNPFTMLFVGDSSDCPLLDALVWQLLKNEKEMRAFLGNLFAYDPKANGLRFALGDMQKKLASLKDIHVTGIMRQTDVPVIVLAEGFVTSYALQSLKLEGTTQGSIFDANRNLMKGSAIKTDANQSDTTDQTNGQNDEQTDTDDTTTTSDISATAETSSTSDTSSQTQNNKVDNNNPHDNNKETKDPDKKLSFTELLKLYKGLPKKFRWAILVAMLLAFILGAILL